jgi:hypothetical protein
METDLTTGETSDLSKSEERRSEDSGGTDRLEKAA